MALENYRDISSAGNEVSAGFQFEFFCNGCPRTWKSPFQPHRMGQLTALISRFAYFLGNARRVGNVTSGFAYMGGHGGKQKALAEAMERAGELFTNCVGCRQGFCADCIDPRTKTCHRCLERSKEESQLSSQLAAERTGGSYEAPAAASPKMVCPSCQGAHGGGRFCAACGFDMASTHKTCPECGAMALRQTRFCADCGHGF